MKAQEVLEKVIDGIEKHAKKLRGVESQEDVDRYVEKSMDRLIGSLIEMSLPSRVTSASY